MSGHTPGPWTIQGNCSVKAPDGWTVAMAWPHPKVDGPMAKNARLIAAAPELLEALILARKALHGLADPKFVSAVCDELITKATGAAS